MKTAAVVIVCSLALVGILTIALGGYLFYITREIAKEEE